MKKICQICGEKYKVDANPRTNKRKGTRHQGKLCEKCWLKLRRKNNALREKRNRKNKSGGYMNKGSKGHSWFSLGSNQFGGNKQARKEIIKRNKKIIQLMKITDRQSKEIIRLKDELKIRSKE